MTGMEHAIEQAAQMMQSERDHPVYLYDEAGEPRGGCEQLARALAEVGLLAPAPLTEETEVDQIVVFGGQIAVVDARRRWVTDWFPAPDLADRAEGDGRAVL